MEKKKKNKSNYMLPTKGGKKINLVNTNREEAGMVC